MDWKKEIDIESFSCLSLSSRGDGLQSTVEEDGSQINKLSFHGLPGQV